MTNEYVLILVVIVSIVTLFFMGACLFFIGYFFGQRTSSTGVSNYSKNNQSISKNNPKHQSITIDDTKVVTEISTSGLEKKYDQLGDTKQSNENIENSINKLKNLKR